jgi:oligoribonuclease
MILWFDCETTGIDERRGCILEVALVITDNKMVELASYEAVIAQGALTLDLTLEPWARKNHAATNLLNEVLESTKSTSEVERELISTIQASCEVGSRAILAGASIPFDRKFIASDMPNLNLLLDSHTYRTLDISVLKEIYSRQFNFTIATELPHHRAMSDIRSSIEQYKEYLKILEPGIATYKRKST